MTWTASVLAVVLSLAGAGSAGAITVSAVADTYLRGGRSADTSFGLDATLLIKSQGAPNFLRRGLVRFDVSGLDQLVGASFSFTLAGTSGLDTDLQIFGMDDSLGDDRDELGITFNDSPAFGSDEFAGTTFLGSVSIDDGDPAGTVLTVETDALLDFVANEAGLDGLVTFGLVSTNTSDTSVLSLRAPETGAAVGQPALTPSTVPLPAAGWVLPGDLGILAAMGRRLA